MVSEHYLVWAYVLSKIDYLNWTQTTSLKFTLFHSTTLTSFYSNANHYTIKERLHVCSDFFKFFFNTSIIKSRGMYLYLNLILANTSVLCLP